MLATSKSGTLLLRRDQGKWPCSGTPGAGGTYALGLDTATGKSVTNVIFLYLHTGVEFVMDALPGAMNAVCGEVVGLTA